MMGSAQPPVTGSRETRLLVVTLIVSAAMLMLLARFRFPERPAPQEVPAAPLERLAARATYEELGGILRTLDRQIAGDILTLAVDGPLDPLTGSAPAPLFVPAIRISADRAVALVDSDRQLDAVPASAAATLVATDAHRGVALLAVVASANGAPKPAAPGDLRGPGYLGGVEATSQGPAVRPLYFGRVDAMRDPRWDEPLLRLSGVQQTLPGGVAVFTLDGRFVGLARPAGRDMVVVPASALQRAAQRLAAGGSIAAMTATLGVVVQPLDAALGAATGANAGVIVSYVAPGGPSAGSLRVGDVIRRIGDTSIRSVADYDARLAAVIADAPVALDIVRAGTAQTVSIAPTAQTSSPATPPNDDLGLELRTIRGTGAEVVRVAPGSIAARAGLRAGDIIAVAGTSESPDATRILRTFRDTEPGRHLLVGVTRGSSHLVMALPRP